MRFRRPRPRSLYRWLLVALALMLAPQFVGAAIGISTQQREISESRAADREIAARLASIARLQVTLDATEDAVLRDPRAGDPRAGPRVRAALARAQDDVDALGAPELERELTQLETLAAGDLATPGAVRRLEAPLDRLRSGTAELSDETIADLRAQEATGRSDQRAHVSASSSRSPPRC